MFLLFFLNLFNPTTNASTLVTMDEAIKSALTQNASILQAKEQVVQADSRYAQLRGGIFPNIGFNLLHQIQPEPTDIVARSFSPAQQTTVSFYVSQPIFKGLREFYGLSQLGYLNDAQETNKDFIRSRLFQDVATVYLQILSFEQDLVNLKEQSELYQKRVEELEARTQRGESNQTDLLTAQSTHSSLLAEIRMVEGNYQASREMFQYLTGLAAGSVLKDPKISTPLLSLQKYVERVEERSDVKMARDRAEAARKGVAIAWGAHAPSVDVVGNYYLVRPGFLSDLKWDIGIKLTMPIFEGFATQAKITEAASKQREANVELERTRRNALQEIRSLYEKLRARLDHLGSLKKSADLSRKNTIIMQKNYRRGLTRSIDVQMALTEFRVTQRSYDQAYYSAQLERIQLQLAAAMIPAISKEN